MFAYLNTAYPVFFYSNYICIETSSSKIFSKTSTSFSSDNKTTYKRKHVTRTMHKKLEINNHLERKCRKFKIRDFNIGSSRVYRFKSEKKRAAEATQLLLLNAKR